MITIHIGADIVSYSYTLRADAFSSNILLKMEGSSSNNPGGNLNIDQAISLRDFLNNAIEEYQKCQSQAITETL
jgi:hypothetical protein